MGKTDAAEPVDRSLDDLEREICELGAHIEAATCTWLLLLAEFDEREGWGVGQAQLAHERRYLRWSWDEDGSLMLQGRIPADEGALLIVAIGDAEHEHVPDEPVAARRADALVSVARSALAASEAERPGGDRCELIVHVDVATLASDELQQRSEVENGPAIPPETARRLGCDAAVVRIIERDGQPLSVGRRTRTIHPALRRALRARDAGCRFPGCTHHRFMHAHHVEHWARGGPTELGNLVQLCSYHHRLVHEGGFQVQNAGSREFRFRRPDGRVVAPAPAGEPATGPTLEQRHRRRGLHLDAETVKPLSVGDSLDYGIAVEALLARVLAAT